MLEELEGKALELKPGSVYVIELDNHLNAEQMHQVHDYLVKFGKPLNIKFLLMAPGLKITRETE